MLDCKKKLFKPGLGTLQEFKAKIDMDPAATPKFCKPWQVCKYMYTLLVIAAIGDEVHIPVMLTERLAFCLHGIC